MFERALNIFWVMLGAAAAAYAWTLGIVGSSGPDSGLFPFISALIVMGAGVVLLLRSRGLACFCLGCRCRLVRRDRLSPRCRAWACSRRLCRARIHGDQHPLFGLCGCQLRHHDHPAAHRREIRLGLLGAALPAATGNFTPSLSQNRPTWS